jgi:cold shock CspA family protein
MLKASVFVDGGFLFSLTGWLRKCTGQPDYRVDLHELPGLLAAAAGGRIGTDICVTGRQWYATEPVGYDPADEAVAKGIEDFHAHLRALAGWDVTTFPMKYAGRRIRQEMQDPEDPFQPQDRFVAVALTAEMIHRASLAGAMDVVLLAAGDVGYGSACRVLRRMGKMVWICGAEALVAPSLLERNVPEPACDGFLALDEMAEKIELDSERSDRPERRDPSPAGDEEVPSGAVRGRIKTLIADKGYGFLESAEGRDYFFHANELEAPLVFEELAVGDIVGFYVASEGQAGKAGKASMVVAPGG